MLITPPLSLYIHIPWCVRKCPYCDFNSHALKGSLPEADYAAALQRDLQQDLPRVTDRTIQTVFFGGGTPSLLRPEIVAHILEDTRRYLTLAEDAEVTLEANPGTIEHGQFKEYRSAGITRLSIGVQSFNARCLQALERIHTAGEAIQAAVEAHAAGLDNFNLDLMYGLPQQSVDQALADVRQALELAPQHLSHYQLTLEPNTLFHARPPILPDDELIWQMQQACQSMLTEQGFSQYEISAYARSGWQCRHNLNYWRFGDYLGLGAGAHSKISNQETGRITRLWKLKQPAAYMRVAGTVDCIGAETEILAPDRVFEFMLNRLRLFEGFSPEDFESATGLPFAQVRPVLEHAQARKLLQMTEGHWMPTSTGYAYLNDLLEQFLPEPTLSARLNPQTRRTTP